MSPGKAETRFHKAFGSSSLVFTRAPSIGGTAFKNERAKRRGHFLAVGDKQQSFPLQSAQP